MGASEALLALTTAALGLPGFQAQAAMPAAQAQGNLQYGHYEESGDRMQVDVYRGDVVVPVSEHLEFTFSIVRDTYSGATPAFSIPETMGQQLKYTQQGLKQEDVVSAASGGVTASGLTVLGGINDFKGVVDGRLANDARRGAIRGQASATAAAAADVQAARDLAAQSAYVQDVAAAGAVLATQTAPIDRALTQALAGNQAAFDQQVALIDAGYPSALAALEATRTAGVAAAAQTRSTEESGYRAANPEPLRPNSITNAVTLQFVNSPPGALPSSIQGKANVSPQDLAGTCPGAGASGCYYESGIALGTVDDPLPSGLGAHLHRAGTSANYRLQYHADSPGIYLRAMNGYAFDLSSMLFKAPIIPGDNPGTGPNDVWEILGFNTAINPALSSGDGTNYANRIAYMTVPNGYDGTLNFSSFKNVNAIWIHYKGYPNTPTYIADGFSLEIDDVKISPSTEWTTFPAVHAQWDLALSTRLQQLDANYQTALARIDADYQAAVATLSGANAAAIQNLQAEKDAANAQAQAGHATQVAVFNADYQAKIDALKATRDQQVAAAAAQYRAAVASANSQARQAEAQQVKSDRDLYVGLFRALLDQTIPKNAKTVEKHQTQPRETRTNPTFGAKYFFDDGTTFGLSAGQSNEPDFESSYGSVDVTRDFNDKLTTLSFGYSYTQNSITRTTDGHASHHAVDPTHKPAIYPALDAASLAHGVSASVSQVLGRNSLLELSGGYTRQSGFLSNPYKTVYVRGEITPEEYYEIWQASEVDWSKITKLEVVGVELFREVRPEVRNQLSISTRINQYLPALKAAPHLDYRYYTDDWGIASHTFALQWFQALSRTMTVTPSLRYFAQSRADFFAPYFLAPRADGHYSSDFRLSGYGALSGGITLSKRFSRGIRFDAGFEYYTHQGALKLGGGGETGYADFDYWMAQAGLSIDLSAPGTLFGAGRAHADHQHDEGPAAPAGIMFAHMLPAGGFMAGYRYRFTAQAGDMQHGTRRVDDAELIAKACGTRACGAKPTSMHMHMHMLDLMYAPTAWLTVMLMPQVMDLDMGLSTLPGAAGDAHGGGHESLGLGDTETAAMIRLFETPAHHAHLTLGLSVPTGETDVSLDGRPWSVDDPLQDYDMQLGSGTWDFKPAVTYTGHAGRWGWGAQISGTTRIESRHHGYALGDILQTTAWGACAVFDWLSTSLRGVYTAQGGIRGRDVRPHADSAPGDFPENHGGETWDLGFGIAATVPAGAFAGHRFAIEWLQPVADRVQGYQLARAGSLSATWSYAF